jgi:hypothetical protein
MSVRRADVMRMYIHLHSCRKICTADTGMQNTRSQIESIHKSRCGKKEFLPYSFDLESVRESRYRSLFLFYRTYRYAGWKQRIALLSINVDEREKWRLPRRLPYQRNCCPEKNCGNKFPSPERGAIRFKICEEKAQLAITIANGRIESHAQGDALGVNTQRYEATPFIRRL